MLHVLTQNILPVFAMLAIGFLLGRTDRFSAPEAAAVNRVAFLLLQPALIFPLIANMEVGEFRFGAVLVYAGCEVVTFTLSFLVAHRLLRRDLREAWLLAMSTVFVNSLLYVWPISYLIYGEQAALPITAIVAWDTAVSFPFFIITTGIIANPEAGLSGSLRRIVSNPVLIAIALGAAVNLADIPVPAPILTAANFAGPGAAPLTLFALGVILSHQSLAPSAPVLAMSGMKLLGFPVLVYAALRFAGTEGHWFDLFELVAAGPSGAMAFALALLHGIRTDAIAPVIIWTSTLSVISLAWLA
jgi:malonate transporter and related proteins